jgi:hypothetical protein
MCLDLDISMCVDLDTHLNTSLDLDMYSSLDYLSRIDVSVGIVWTKTFIRLKLLYSIDVNL